MRHTSSVFSSLALACLMVSTAPSQQCGTGRTLLKNDNLPAVPPPPPTGVSVIPGLCEGEACAAVFDVSSLGTVQIHDASIGFFNAAGAQGITAAVDLEFFDGISWSGGIPTLGPSVFRFSTAAGASIQLTSSGINQSPSLSSFNITVSSGTLVVAWWMDINPSGTCAAGFRTNFTTDNAGAFGFCTAGSRKNLIFIEGQGWRDAATATAGVPPFTLPICPLFYNGNWILRACVEQQTVSCGTETVGTGTRGSQRLEPILTSIGGSPQVGNPAFGLLVALGLGGSPGVMLIGTSQVTFPFVGGTVYVLPLTSVPFVLGGSVGSPGAGSVALPLGIPNDPGGAGLQLIFQAGAFDPGAVSQLALTAGLRVTICP